MGCITSQAHPPDATPEVVAADHVVADRVASDHLAADHVGLRCGLERASSKTDFDTQSTSTASFFSIHPCTKESAIVASPNDSRRESTESGASKAFEAGARVVLGRYAIGRGQESTLGEGASGVCYLGVDMETGNQVAIKEYKNKDPCKAEATLTKFRRQVAVLLELRKPFERPSDKILWSKALVAVEPSDLFVTLLDFSRDEKGEPGQHPADGSMYVVTELAECTMKSVLRKKHEQNETLTAEQIREYARDIMLAVAGLHCKGFVHLDLKPGNMMLCGGRWKLIDMDGCVRAGETLRHPDSSLSFSPLYCAPEFARFILNGGSIVANPGLDAWSVGMIIVELVNLCPVLESQYAKFRAIHSHNAATSDLLRWISNLRAVPMSKPLLSAEPQLLNCVKERLLVINRARRGTVAECLSFPYFQA